MRLLRFPAVMALVGLRRSAIYLRVADGRFPQPRHVGRATLWLASEISDWIRRVCESGEPAPGTYPVRNEAAG